MIAKRWQGVSKVRIFLISNRLLSARVDGREGGEHEGVPVTFSVWISVASIALPRPDLVAKRL